ncbi:MAG: hypothetical protein ACE5IK_13945 [Acidobacteriota bacterium]
MTTLALVLATALLLGMLHAFDPDHLAAVTAFIARRPSARSAMVFATRWAAGHAATLLVAGLACTLFSLVITHDIAVAAELAVGAMLMSVGIWVLLGLARGRLLLAHHMHGESGHTHLHRPGHPLATSDRAAGHSIFWVGALHGLAGSAGFVVIIPVAMLASAWQVIAYILVFSFGVAAAMAVYALAIGGLFGRVARRSARWYPWVTAATGTSTVLLGMIWIALTLGGLTA